MRITLMLAAASLALASVPALAQSQSAYQIGRQVAVQRGVGNPDCYARVFARHAQLVELRSGGRSWNAQSTQAYNSDMRRSCGVDRMALVRSQPVSAGLVPVQPAGRRQQASPRQQAQQGIARTPTSGAYSAGLNLAARRGYANRDCFARWYARKASPMAGRGYAIWGYHHDRSDLWNECRIAM